MVNVIKLRPTDNNGQYLALSVKSSIKKVNGKNKEVTPVSIVGFMGNRDILENPPENSELFGYNKGYALDEYIYFPKAMGIYLGKIKKYKKGAFAVVSTDSNILIDSYRALQIFGALPSINGDNITDMRTAEKFIKDYLRFKQFGPEGAWNKLKSGMRFGSKLPESAKKYNRKIGRKTLIAILQSVPADIDSNKLTVGGKTNLVFVSPSLQANELEDLLEHSR